MDDAQAASLKKEIQDLRKEFQSWKDNLQGQGGVTVSGNIIAADPGAMRPRASVGGGSGGSTSGTSIDIFCVFNGATTLVRFQNASVLS